MSLTTYPPFMHPAWNYQIPTEPGTYWYDNCWGSYSERREPMLLEIEYHDGGMGLKDAGPEHVMHGYTGQWAPIDWESIVAQKEEEKPIFEKA